MTIKQNPAVDAARVAYRIATSYEYSEPIVVRMADFNDAQVAVEAALQARNADLPATARYRFLHIDADYNVRGAHSRLEDVEFGLDDGRMLAVVVTVHAAHEISKPTEISVLNSLDREIKEACEESSDFAPYISTMVFIIDET